jgi:hypothetical protein
MSTDVKAEHNTTIDNSPRPRFSRHQDRLILAIPQRQALVGESADFVHVRLQRGTGIFIKGLVPYQSVGIVTTFLLRVELIVPLVRVDRNDDIPRARVGLGAQMAQLQIVQNRGL